MVGKEALDASMAGRATTQQDTQKKESLLGPLVELILPRFPDLRRKLRTADIVTAPQDFMEKTLNTAVLISAALIILTYFLLADRFVATLKNDILGFVLTLVAPLVVIPLIVFYYLMMYPDAAILRRQRDMDYEVVFAGRHMLIALKSGLPLFDTLVGTSNGYGPVSREFARIVDQIVLGVPVAQAIREIVQYNPSKYFTRIMMQIANAVASGADVSGSLDSVLEQVSKEQIIALKEYSQKLTPIVMFYMVFGIIIPSLGIVLATVIFSAISGGKFGFSSGILVIVFVVIALIQFLFLGFIESSRPKYLI